MNPIDTMRQDLIIVLDNYEEKVRHYITKIEQDRPGVAEAIWEAVWRHRTRILTSHDTLISELEMAKHAGDSG